MSLKIFLGIITFMVGMVFALDLIINQRVTWTYLLALGVYLWMYWLESKEKRK